MNLKTMSIVAISLATLSITGCDKAEPKLPDKIEVVDAGVVCNQTRGLCFDRQGLSLGLTDAFIGKQSVDNFLSGNQAPKLDIGISPNSRFSISETLHCENETQSCYNSISGEIDQVITDTLFSNAHIVKDPTPSELLGKTWYWQRTSMNNDETFKPVHDKQFSLQFLGDSQIELLIDCNLSQGGVKLNDNKIAIGAVMTTLMACPGEYSEAEFMKGLSSAQSWFIKGNKLILELPYDSGSMIFIGE